MVLREERRGEGRINPTLSLHQFESGEFRWTPEMYWPENALKLVTIRENEEGQTYFEMYELGIFRWNKKQWIICSPRSFWEDSRLFIDVDGRLTVRAFSYWQNLQSQLITISDRFSLENIPQWTEWKEFHIQEQRPWTLDYFNPLLPTRQTQGTFFHPTRNPKRCILNLNSFRWNRDDQKVLELIKTTQSSLPCQRRVWVQNPESSQYTWELKGDAFPKPSSR